MARNPATPTMYAAAPELAMESRCTKAAVDIVNVCW
jgi:hypothetical protein